MKSTEEQLSDLRCAVIAMAESLGAALPVTVNIARTLSELVDSESRLQAGEPD